LPPKHYEETIFQQTKFRLYTTKEENTKNQGETPKPFFEI